MNLKRCLLLLLTLCICFSLLSIGVAAADDHDHSTTTAEKTVFGIWALGDFISLCIAAAVLVVVIVLCIVKRKKVAEALRAYRSEMKKITWYSWKNVVRGTVFVLVCMLVIAVVAGLLDFVFFELQALLAEMK